ncbi:unnamed protein product [Pleuronectes platessa]|uniref:Uncharacterized protein n=1 Tax=Pleuronectes platessa TaxID=8262 RepID=A0A9N7U0Z7_PLEPL|nr:unnamed protein product [Pleuronectes platessa]
MCYQVKGRVWEQCWSSEVLSGRSGTFSGCGGFRPHVLLEALQHRNLFDMFISQSVGQLLDELCVCVTVSDSPPPAGHSRLQRGHTHFLTGVFFLLIISACTEVRLLRFVHVRAPEDVKSGIPTLKVGVCPVLPPCSPVHDDEVCTCARVCSSRHGREWGNFSVSVRDFARASPPLPAPPRRGGARPLWLCRCGTGWILTGMFSGEASGRARGGK